jgi:hypothetical protein
VYNRNLVGIVILASVLEIASFIILSVMYRNGTIIDFNVYLMWVSLFSSLFVLPFYIILVIYQGYQKRYLVLSTLSIISLVSFHIFFLQVIENGYGVTSGVADVTLVSAVGAVITAIYISVDDGTYGFVKKILIANSLFLVIYKTPLFIYILAMILRIFEGNVNVYNIVFMAFLASQYLFTLVLGILKIPIVNKIDYI